MTLVVDSSFLIAAMFEEEHTAFVSDYLRRRSDDELIAPTLLRWEVGNVLLMKVRRGVQTVAEANERARAFETLKIGAPNVEPSPEALLHAAVKHGLTVYDAAYVDLALRLDATLATLDAPMARAAQAAGVTVYSPSV